MTATNPAAGAARDTAESPAATHATGESGPLSVVAAAIVEDGRLLVVSKKADPAVFYLPGGKPDPGEAPLDTLTRELAEELGATPLHPRHLADIEEIAALEHVPMRLTVYQAALDRPPHPAAELAAFHWTSGHTPDLHLSPALRNHVLPLLRHRGLLPS